MKQNIISAFRFLLILLFIYAAVSKLLILEVFKQQLAQSPLIPPYFISMVSWSLPLFEIGIAILLVFDRTVMFGFFLSTLIMFFFSLYLIGLVFFFSNNLPCACGGILNKMGYTEHIIFNLIFTFFASFGLFYFQTTNSNEIS